MLDRLAERVRRFAADFRKRRPEHRQQLGNDGRILEAPERADGDARRLGVAARASDRAVDAAYAEQRAFNDKLLEAGRRALATLEAPARRRGPIHGPWWRRSSRPKRPARRCADGRCGAAG